MFGAVLCSFIIGQESRFEANFKLFPAVEDAPVVSQVDADSFKQKALAKVYRGKGPGQVAVDNGVALFEANLNTFAQPLRFTLKKPVKVASDLPVPVIELNGRAYELGGKDNLLRPVNAKGLLFTKPFDVKGVIGPAVVWPPRGMGVRFMWNHPDLPDLFVELTYQMVDREPLLNQTVVIRNGSGFPVALNSLKQGDGLWPPHEYAANDLGWVVRPGRTLELPEAWFSIDPSGKWVSGVRKAASGTVTPWQKISARTLTKWPPDELEVKALAKSTDVVLIPRTVLLAWSAPDQRDYDAVAGLAALAKKHGVGFGAEIGLDLMPANPEDRVGGFGSPICWLSFAGSHWRSNVMLTWKRMGLSVVELSGELPGACPKTGHGEHQNSVQGQIENALAIRNLMRNGLSLGIIVRHPDAKPYGPGTTY